jgi:cell division transport system permease protein
MAASAAAVKRASRPRAAADSRLLRPRAFDDLGLRRALGDRILPLLVAAMTFLAALALAGAFAAAALAGHWQSGAGSALTVQVPHDIDPERRDKVLAILRASPGVDAARLLPKDELDTLLRPWLGAVPTGTALPMPAVIAVHLSEQPPDLAELGRRLDLAAPGTLTESHGVWVRRLAVLARSLQACAWLALAVVGLVASAVVMVATRAGLTARREAIEIVHGLGATDGYIAGRFANRATRLAAWGGLAGAVAALPVLLALADLAAPFVRGDAVPQMTLEALPPPLWLALALLPAAMALLGFVTAQATVRQWLRHLP